MADDLDTTLAGMMKDPDFAKFNESDRIKLIVGAFDKHGMTGSPEEKRKTALDFLTKHGIAKVPTDDPRVQIGRQVPAWLSATERVAEVPAWAAGEIGGAALGAPAGAAAGTATLGPFMGTALGGAAGAYGGARLGGGAAQTAMDVAEAELHHKLYNTPIDVSGKSVAGDLAANTLGGAGGHALFGALAPHLGRFGRSLLGMPEAESALRGAAERSQVVRRDVQEGLGNEAGTLTKKAEAAVGQGEKDIKAGATERVEAVDAQREAQRQAAIGRLPAQTMIDVGAEREDTGLATPEALERRSRLQGSYFGPVRRMSEEIGKRFEQTFGQYRAMPAEDLSPMMQAVGEETAYRKENQLRYDPQVSRLIGVAKRMAKIPLDEDEERLLTGSSQKVFVEQGSKGGLKEMAALPTSVGEPDELTPLNKPATVGNVLAFRSKASQLTATAKDAPSRAAAFSLLKGADEVLGQMGVPEAQGLRQQAKEFYDAFPHQLGRSISRTLEPSDAASEIFKHVPRAKALVAAATPEERKGLQELWGDYANRQIYDGKTTEQFISPEDKFWLAKLFPGSPLADRRQMASVEQRIATLSQMPQFRQQYQRATNAAIEQARTEGATAIRDLGLREAKKLGPIGKTIASRINAAKTPEEAAQITTEAFTGLTPEQFVKQLAEQKYPATVARGIAKDPSQIRGMMPWITRLGESPGAWKWYLLGTAATGAVFGAPSHFMALIAGLGAATEARRGLQTAMIRSLRDPKAAQAFLSGLANVGDRSAIPRFARMTVQAGLEDAAAKIGKREAGITLEPKTSAQQTRPPTPTAPRNPVDPSEIKGHGGRALTAKVSGTKAPPDIDVDLRSGKVSTEEIKEALKKSTMDRRGGTPVGVEGM